LKSGVIPIVLGSSKTLPMVCTEFYDVLEQMVNIVAIDSKFDFEKTKRSCPQLLI
jgi:hypothetical protein